MMRQMRERLILSLSLLLIIFFIVFQFLDNSHPFDTKESDFLFDIEANSEWSPFGIVNNSVDGYEVFIVPNIVHYVLLDCNNISFVHYLSIKSVLSIQKPEKIIIHSNYDKLEGKHWRKLKDEYKDIHNIVFIRKVVKINTVFGRKFSNIWHSSDVMRIMALMEFGGIYLDRDVVVVQSLDEFRKYEMTLDFQSSGEIGNQVQIAHKRARFLRLYLKTYQKYDGSNWYWNAGQYPVERIINKYPHLIHRMNGEFGVSNACDLIYVQNIENWRQKYYTFHLLMRDNTIKATLEWYNYRVTPQVLYFDEQNVKTLKTTFGQIARFILYNTTDILN